MHRVGRYSRHTRFWGSASLAVIVLVGVVVLVVQNTRHVKVGWIFGESRISLVFLVLFAAILGWILGVATTLVFQHRIQRRR